MVQIRPFALVLTMIILVMVKKVLFTWVIQRFTTVQTTMQVVLEPCCYLQEEKGLWGSKHFVNNSTIPLPQIDAMINLDMVGRLRPDDRISVHGNGTSPVWNELVSKADNGFTYSFSPSGIGPSDHTSFYLMNIPVLFFFTGQHKDYHKPSDDVININFQGIQKITNLIQGVVMQLDKLDDIPFKKTKDESVETPDFKVTLGVMPDYMFSGKGMRIDAVREERPAQCLT